MAARLRRNEADSVAGWPEGHFYLARRGGALGGVAISLRCGRSVRESGSKNLFHHFRISDNDAAVEGIWEDVDDQAARILRAASVPDSAGCVRVHGAGVCDFLA